MTWSRPPGRQRRLSSRRSPGANPAKPSAVHLSSFELYCADWWGGPPGPRPTPPSASVGNARIFRTVDEEPARGPAADQGADQDSPPFVKVFSKGGLPFVPDRGAASKPPLGFIAFWAGPGEDDVKTVPALSALGSALRSHPCVALSSAQAISSLSNLCMLLSSALVSPHPFHSLR